MYLRSLPAYLTVLLLFTAIGTDSLLAQRDNVYLVKQEGERATKRVTGQVTKTTADSVEVQSSGRTNNVAVETIQKVVYSGEPGALDRARARMFDGRFDDCLKELDKITEAPSSTLIQQEIDFYRAASNSKIALRGGSVTAKVAGNSISQFVSNYPQSFHFYEAVDLKAQLLLAIGKPDLAEAEFQKLTVAKAPEIMLNGLFQLANTQLLLDKTTAAKGNFAKIDRVDANSPLARQYKIAAKCQLAKIQGTEGDVAAAIADLQAIIKSEPEENEIIMAHAYNALGACYLNSGNLKSAALAYLHNDLLFQNQDSTRAEALYQLSKIWAQLNRPDDANRARSTLLSRYRNSIWAGKL